jgi:hypothetical protein
MPPMPKTRRRNRKTKPVEAAPSITVADYYRMRLTQPQPTDEPASWEDYLRLAGA